MQKFYRVEFSWSGITVKVKKGDVVSVYKNGRQRSSYNEKNVVSWYRETHEKLFGKLYKKQMA